MVNNLLIWNKSVGFIHIYEGDGSNLLPEDEIEGYVDYMMIDFLEYDGYELTETNGAQVMLKELYQDKFTNEIDVINHLIKTGWIPDNEYVCLYAMEEND